MRRLLVCSLLLAMPLSAQNAAPARIKSVSPLPLISGRTITVIAERGEAVQARIRLSLLPKEEKKDDKTFDVISVGTVGVDRHYHALLPELTPGARYRLYLQYGSVQLVAPEVLRAVRPSPLANYGWIFGIGAVLLGLLVAAFITRWKIWELWRGTDGKPSTSKFQFALWTAVVLFTFGTYAALYLLHYKSIDPDADCGVPQNIWIALGLSAITTVAAKGITVGPISAGRVSKQTTAGGGLVEGDDGQPDLIKVQLLTWTFVAIGIYLWQLVNDLADVTPGSLATAPACHIPDIDTTLMVLMGLSQGTYLGKKLVSTDTARIQSLNPLTGTTGATINILGAGFGEPNAGNVILVDNQIVPVPSVWTDGQVSFALPATINGIPLTPGPHTISLIVNGRGSVGTAKFTVLPNVTSVQPPTVSISAQPWTIVLHGHTFGATSGVVLFDQVALPAQDIVRWSDAQITFKLGATHPSGRAWTAGSATIAVSAGGAVSAAATISIGP